MNFITKLVQSLHPGSIDNRSLQARYGLLRTIVEGRDYVLLSTNVVTKLHAKYGGGPLTPRRCLNFGTVTVPVYKVELFPVPVVIYYCDWNHPDPVEQEPYYKTLYFYENVSLIVVAQRTVSEMLDNVIHRVWIRERNPTVDTDADGGRLLTRTAVEVSGTWRRFYKDADCDIRTKWGADDCVELMIERATSSTPSAVDWPRFAHLEAWKQRLQVGDYVDAKDRSGVYYPVQIRHVDMVGNLTVQITHMNTVWQIPAAYVPERIAPLYSRSEDRKTGSGIAFPRIPSTGSVPLMMTKQTQELAQPPVDEAERGDEQAAELKQKRKRSIEEMEAK